jgi:Na+/proline symporter
MPYQPGMPGMYNPYAAEALNKDANKALVLGIISLLICGPLGFAAIWEGNKVRKAATGMGIPEPGTSKAGRILGIIALVWMAAVILLMIVSAAAAPDPASTYYPGY